MRDVDAFALGHLPDGFSRPGGDYISVESEEQLIGHGLMLSVLVGRFCLTLSIRLTARLGSLIREMLHGCDEGIGRGLTKPANRRVAHGLRKLVQQFRIPIVALKQRHRLVAADTTRS